jgi:MarR family 2-MHQ and catechol resistance regulon transcriptional repressor
MSNSKQVELYRQTHRLVKKLKRRSIKEMDILDSLGITRSEFRVLLVLDSDVGKPLGEIARGWSMQNSNITTNVNLLVGKGLAVKKKDERDRRVTKVLITDEGKEVRSRVTAEFNEKINELLEKVSEEKIDAALDAVNDILDQL